MKPRRSPLESYRFSFAPSLPLSRLFPATVLTMQTQESDIIDRVRGFVQENFLYMRPDFELADDDRLLERGVVDSMGIVEMIAFIEEAFGISAAEEEISEGNLGSLRAIAQFIVAKQSVLVA